MLHRRFSTPVAVVLLAVALVGGSALMCTALSVGSKAPDFTLNQFNGKSIKLSDYTDKPTVVVFWASWCPHCVRELPVIDKLSRDLRGKANFIGVDMDSNSTTGRDFVNSHHIGFPVAIGRGDVARQYDVSGIPSVFILGKGGVVKSVYAGEVSESTIRSDLAKQGVK